MTLSFEVHHTSSSPPKITQHAKLAQFYRNPPKIATRRLLTLIWSFSWPEIEPEKRKLHSTQISDLESPDSENNAYIYSLHFSNLKAHLHRSWSWKRKPQSYQDSDTEMTQKLTALNAWGTPLSFSHSFLDSAASLNQSFNSNLFLVAQLRPAT